MTVADDIFKQSHIRFNYVRRWEALKEENASPTTAWRPSDDTWQHWLIEAVNAAWKQSVLQKKLTFDGFVKAALKQTRSTRIRLHKFDCVLVDEVCQSVPKLNQPT